MALGLANWCITLTKYRWRTWLTRPRDSHRPIICSAIQSKYIHRLFPNEVTLSTMWPCHLCKAWHCSLAHIQRCMNVRPFGSCQCRSHICRQCNRIRHHWHLDKALAYQKCLGSCIYCLSRAYPCTSAESDGRQGLTMLKPWSANSRAWSPDVAYMPLLFSFSFAARWILAMASFRSSCIVPSMMECPMLLPKSKGPTNRTSIPGTFAIAST